MDNDTTWAPDRVQPPNLVAGPTVRWLWVAAVVVLMVVAALGLTLAYRQPELIAIPQFVELIRDLGVSERLAMIVTFALPIVFALALAVVVYIGHRTDGMALLFALGLLGVFVYSSGSAEAVRARMPDLAPLALAAELIALEALAFLLYLFPNGRLQPRWTRFTLFPAALSVAAFPPMATAVRRVISDPEAVPTWLVALTLVVTTVLIAGAAVGQYVKYRHYATSIERLQMRWVLLGLAGLVVPATLMTLAAGLLPRRWVGWVIVGAAVSSPLAPLTAGVAIFRYRLYDIALVINRTLVYLMLTGFLAVVYVGLVMVLSQLTATGSDIEVAASTLAVAALFLPARRRIQAFVDARFHRSRYDAIATLEAFGSRLRKQVDLTTLQHDLASIVQRSLQPEQLSLWLTGSRPGTTSAQWTGVEKAGSPSSSWPPEGDDRPVTTAAVSNPGASEPSGVDQAK